MVACSPRSLVLAVALLFAIDMPFGEAPSHPVSLAEEREHKVACRTVPGIVADTLARHLVHGALTPELGRRTFERYVRRLMDVYRWILSDSDLDWLRGSLEGVVGEEIGAALREGDCSLFEAPLRRVRAAFWRTRAVLPSAAELEAQLHAYIERHGTVTAVSTANGDIALGPELLGSLVRSVGAWRERAGLEASVRFAVARLFARLAEFQADLERAIDERVVGTFLSSLDPHSSHVPPSRAEAIMEEKTTADEVGVGLVLGGEPTPLGLPITRVASDGPAGRSGRVRVGDIVSEVDGVSIIGASSRSVSERFAGRAGEAIVVTLVTDSGNGPIERWQVTLVRERIPRSLTRLATRRSAVGRAEILTIRLTEFYFEAARDLRELIEEELGRASFDVLVLDLRQNRGGLLNEAVRIAGLFVSHGPVLCWRQSFRSLIISDDEPSVTYEGLLVVAVDGASASATEITAGVLQDLGRAIVVGAPRTHGKGTIQVLEWDRHGGLLSVTIGQSYLPGGRSPQRVGVISDVIVPGPVPGADGAGEGRHAHAVEADSRLPFVDARPLAERESAVLDALRLQVDARMSEMSLPRTADEQLEEIERVAGDYAALFAQPGVPWGDRVAGPVGSEHACDRVKRSGSTERHLDR